jgi:hypothetical protein
MVLDIIGDLFTHDASSSLFIFDDRIVGLLGKLPILSGSEIAAPAREFPSLSLETG